MGRGWPSYLNTKVPYTCILVLLLRKVPSQVGCVSRMCAPGPAAPLRLPWPAACLLTSTERATRVSSPGCVAGGPSLQAAAPHLSLHGERP